MDLGFWLAFLLFFSLLPLLLGQEYPNSTCPKEFKCPNLTALEFPFYNNTGPRCGLCYLDCTQSPPRIKLTPWSEWFDVLGVFASSNVMKLRAPEFSALLQNENCDILTYDLLSLSSPSISFTTTSNVTLFKCIEIPPARQEIFNHSGYTKHDKKCSGFDIYYPVQNHSDPQVSPDPFPSGCSPIQLPMRPMGKILNYSNLFDLLTDDFYLQWNVSQECNRCHSGGGLCESYENQFHCAIGETSKKKHLEVIIGSSVAGGVILIVLAIVLILYKKGKGISFRPRNSKEHASKLDLQGGSAIYFGLPVFSYGELEEITNNFDVSKELGSGGFGVVYYGKLHDGREVAVKRLFEHNFKRITQFLNEVEILTRLRHPNLVSLYGCTSRRCRELLLVYEYIPNGTVADHLHGDRAKDQLLTWPVRMNIAIETAGALAYLHASDIIHRDVKTYNILLDHNFQVKVADFGLSRLFPDDVSHISTAPQGTPGYVDPEYHECYQLTDKSDVYSFGVVLIELISSMPAVDISRHRHEINLADLAINRIQRHAFNELIDPSLGYDSDPEVTRMTISVAELAFQCLQLEKELRPTMDEVFENLKAIQDCNEDFIEMTKVTSENTAELDDVVLLKKNIKFLSLPLPETDLTARDPTKTS